MDDVGQKVEVIRHACAHAGTRWRMPPMLNVSLGKLARGSAKDVRSRFIVRAMDEGCDVLELVAKSIGAAGLVEPCSRPDTASQHLIEQPAVHHEVEGRIWRSDRDGVQQMIPLL
ncbi:hypothetical protein D9M68_547810 [compost metagenome]